MRLKRWGRAKEGLWGGLCEYFKAIIKLTMKAKTVGIIMAL